MPTIGKFVIGNVGTLQSASNIYIDPVAENYTYIHATSSNVSKAFRSIDNHLESIGTPPTLSGNNTFTGQLTASNGINVSNYLLATNDIVTIPASLTASNGINVSSHLTADNGVVTIPASLTASNGIDISSHLTADNGVVTISGKLTASNGLLVTGDVSFDDATFTGDVTLGNDANDVVTIPAEITASAGMLIPDDKNLYFGTDKDASIEYDENGTDELRFSGASARFEQAVAFGGGLTSSGGFEVQSDLAGFKGNVDISGSLTVGDPVTIQDTNNDNSPTTLLNLRRSGNVVGSNPGARLEMSIPYDGTYKKGIAIDGIKSQSSSNNSTSEIQFSTSDDDETLDHKVTISTDGLAVAGGTSTVPTLGSGPHAFYVATDGNASSLTVRNSTGNVGIGTSSPDYTLEVEESDTSIYPNAMIKQASTGNASLGFRIGSTTSYAIGIDNSDSDKFKIGYVNGENASVETATSLTIDTGGNVGIGTSSPKVPLDVYEMGGLLLGYTRLNNGGATTNVSYEMTTSMAVPSSSWYTTFTAPASGKVEIRFEGFVASAAASACKIYLGLSTSSSWSSLGNEYIREVWETDAGDNVTIEHSWVLTGLTAGDTYTYYIGTKAGATSSQYWRYGGTNVNLYKDLTIKTMALPNTIVTD